MKVNSKQPRKQRKSLFRHKNHQRSKLLTVRVADFVEFKDFEGEVIEITKNQRAKIKEATFDKVDGTQFHPAIHISKMVITKFQKEKKMDPWRASMIERKAVFGFREEGLTAPKKQKEEGKD
ncbi:MAG: 60S ribosomal protein L26 [Promethearchaeota archaeon]